MNVTPSNTVRVSASKQLANFIKAELAVFENSGTRGRCLEKVYLYLLTIPATSVEAEQAFQRLGFLRQKCDHVSVILRWTMDMLCFLHGHYKQYRDRKNN